MNTALPKCISSFGFFMMVEESAVKLIGLKAPIDVQSGRDVVTAKGIAYDHFHTQTIQSQASHGWW